MLAYLARTLPVVLRARLRTRGGTISRISKFVSPRQVDLNLHMNQAAYAEVVELGRVDWLLRTGVWPRWRRAGVNPVVAEQTLVYRRELKPLQRFVVDTRAVALEGKLLHFETHLLVGDRVHARADVRLIFVGPRGVVRESELAELCEGVLAPALTVTDWRV